MWKWMELTRDAREPVRAQIYRIIKEQILCGSLCAKEPLPSTRQLAADLGISRSTVVEAYDMLLAEGFLSSRPGAPTVVAEGLMLPVTPREIARTHREVEKPILADFQTGRPDLNLFPHALWQRLLAQTAARLSATDYGYTGPQGYLPLREQIANWLGRNRGFQPDAEDIFITAGATHALRILADLLCAEGGTILMEDPCHMGLYETLKIRGCGICPVPADERGIQTDCLAVVPDARAIYVTPSHQFPLGGILPAPRRAALLRYAQAQGIYIIEDDYDSEFRYTGAPIAPLCSMDAQRVIYVGTFSKTVFPALRIGFAVLPRELQARWCDLRTHLDVQNPPFEQAALAEFLRSRKLDRHIRAMKQKYAKRRQTLLNALKEAFGDDCSVSGDAAGLHVAVRFRGYRFDERFQADCERAGVNVASLEEHCIVKGRHEDELVLGYGHLEPEAIRSAVALLTRTIRASAGAERSAAN